MLPPTTSSETARSGPPELGDNVTSIRVHGVKGSGRAELGVHEHSAGSYDYEHTRGEGDNEPSPPSAIPPSTEELIRYNTELRNIFREVSRDGRFNHLGARRRVPSGLNIEAWKRYLSDYNDQKLVDYLAYGWPINFDRSLRVQSTLGNHPSALQTPGRRGVLH